MGGGRYQPAPASLGRLFSVRTSGLRQYGCVWVRMRERATGWNRAMFDVVAGRALHGVATAVTGRRDPSSVAQRPRQRRRLDGSTSKAGRPFRGQSMGRVTAIVQRGERLAARIVSPPKRLPISVPNKKTCSYRRTKHRVTDDDGAIHLLYIHEYRLNRVTRTLRVALTVENTDNNAKIRRFTRCAAAWRQVRRHRGIIKRC